MPLPASAKSADDVYLVCAGEMLAVKDGEVRRYLVQSLLDPRTVTGRHAAGEQEVQLLRLPRSAAALLLPAMLEPPAPASGSDDKLQRRYGWLRRPRRAK